MKKGKKTNKILKLLLSAIFFMWNATTHTYYRINFLFFAA